MHIYIYIYIYICIYMYVCIMHACRASTQESMHEVLQSHGAERGLLDIQDMEAHEFDMVPHLHHRSEHGGDDTEADLYHVHDHGHGVGIQDATFTAGDDEESSPEEWQSESEKEATQNDHNDDGENTARQQQLEEAHNADVGQLDGDGGSSDGDEWDAEEHVTQPRGGTSASGEEAAQDPSSLPLESQERDVLSGYHSGVVYEHDDEDLTSRSEESSDAHDDDGEWGLDLLNNDASREDLHSVADNDVSSDEMPWGQSLISGPLVIGTFRFVYT